MADFCKNKMQRTYNENIRTRLKKSMAQADAYNNIGVKMSLAKIMRE